MNTAVCTALFACILWSWLMQASMQSSCVLWLPQRSTIVDSIKLAIKPILIMYAELYMSIEPNTQKVDFNEFRPLGKGLKCSIPPQSAGAV